MTAAPARAYTPPSWATKPTAKWGLDVLKGGVLAESIDLSTRDHYVVGRLPEICDVVAAHDSVSRQHAALQFGEQGELYITDMGSTHGTKLNKERLRPNVYTLCPVGSLLQFGESTRLYVVTGPEDYAPQQTAESQATAAFRAASEARQVRKAAEKAGVAGPTTTGAAEASWGMASDANDALAAIAAAAGISAGGAAAGGSGISGGDDDEVYDDDVDDSGGYAMGKRALRRLRWMEEVDQTKLSEKEHAMYDKLHTRVLRLRNLCNEIEKVHNKAAGGGGGKKKGVGHGKGGLSDLAAELEQDIGTAALTPQQLALVAKHEGAIDRTLQQVDDEEESLRERLEARGVLKARSATATIVAAANARASRESAAISALRSARDDGEGEDGDVRDLTARAAAAGAAGRPAGKQFVVVKRATTAGAVTATAPASSRVAIDASRAAAVKPAGVVSPASVVVGASAAAAPVAAPTAAAPPASYERCVVRVAELEIEIEEKQAQVEQLEARVRRAASSGDVRGGGDDLDAYMQRTQSAVDEQNLVACRRELAALEAEKERCAAMAEALRPADVAFFGEQPKASDAMPPPAAVAARVEPVRAVADASVAAARDRAAAGDGHGDGGAAAPLRPPTVVGTTSSAEHSVGGFKRPRPPVPVDDAEDDGSGVASSAERGHDDAADDGSAAAGAGPASLHSASDAAAAAAASQPGAAKRPRIAGPARPPPAAPAAVAGDRYDSDDVDVNWRPPVGQTGDGRTALNDKLGY